MTTVRHRRSPSERAVGILRAEQKRLEARAAKSKALWQMDEAAAEAMRQQIAMLLPMPEVDDTLTGTADDQKWANYSASQLRGAVRGLDAQDASPAPQGEASAPAAEEVGAKPILYLKPDIPLTCAPEIEGMGPHLHEQIDGKWYCVGREV